MKDKAVSAERQWLVCERLRMLGYRSAKNYSAVRWGIASTLRPSAAREWICYWRNYVAVIDCEARANSAVSGDDGRAWNRSARKI